MMGAYDLNPRVELAYGADSQQPWSPSMDGGLPAVANLSDRFSALGVGDSSKDQLFQVKKAVEDAEAIIIQQLEENSHLRDELQRRTQELEQLKLGATSIRSSADLPRDEPNHYKVQALNSSPGNEADSIRWLSNVSSTDLHGTLAIQQTGNQESEAPSLRPSSGNHHYPESGKLNGTLKGFSGVQSGIENSAVSQLSTPSSRSLSPSRNRKEGDYDPRLTLPGPGLLPAADVNLNVLWKQDLVVKVREREEEIIQLRKHLADYSVKESQIRNEKYVLEKRIAYMRMAFDQQQQDLVDAASKALSYRQDIIEENIRLTYALQGAQQERSTFVSSLLPLLSEYSLQPNVLDAQSIVGNLKVLFKHLQEKLIITEEKLKESQYQLTPWRQEISNNTSFPSQSSSHTLGASLATQNNNSLEIVPQPPYSHGQSPVSSPSNAQTRVNWDALGKQNHHSTSSGVATRNLEVENLARTSPFVGRASMSEDRLAIGDQATHSSIESRNQNPSSKDYAVGNMVDDIDAAVVQPGRETPVHWGSGSSPYMPSALDEPNSSYPYLPTVLEEPGSSVSEAADDDPLPAIEGLQISGDAFPGRELQASGYSINGTTSCNFEWVRYLEDGSVNYIDGAKQPKYLVTADDVDSYLAIEVQPLDNRKRKGELVKVFANDQRKITCDPEMQEQIEKAYSVGHVSFEVALSARALDIWEHATLAVKREGYSIKCNGPRGVVVTEKFQPSTAIMIPYGQPTEFSVTCASDVEYLLRAFETDLSRDTIVLTMRLFKMRAVEKKKSKKRGLFFK